MSDTSGSVLFQDGLKMFLRYQGTSDVCYPDIDEDLDAIWEGRPRRPDGRYSWDVAKDCTHHEPVTIYSSYGGGFYWSGRACRTCKVITFGWSPYGFGPHHEDAAPDLKDGIPDWGQAHYDAWRAKHQ